ncbi:MAG: hypothetical protein QOF35_616 [Actinomycetota bacterium]|jgi:hypothetical protein|nr:hypothetical protein [Actinomycetota bacterium]
MQSGTDLLRLQLGALPLLTRDDDTAGRDTGETGQT